jgi:hypothetical protein
MPFCAGRRKPLPISGLLVMAVVKLQLIQSVIMVTYQTDTMYRVTLADRSLPKPYACE